MRSTTAAAIAARRSGAGPRRESPPACNGRPVRRTALAVLLAACTWALVAAQTLPDDAPLPAAASAALERAAAAVERGRADPTPPHPDHPDWRAALDAAREAVDVVDHARTQRALARVYGLSGWSVRSLAAFDALVAAGHPLEGAPDAVAPDVASLTLYARAAADMAFARYQAGDAEGAERVYVRWLALDPDAVEPLRWLGRLALERVDPEAALPYWRRLVEIVPDDDAARFYLAEAEREVAVGPVAAGAFRDGVEAYERGDVAEAHEAFVAARAANPDYLDAAVWAGRTALELERPGVAVEYWTAVAAARPDDAGVRYFLRLAEDQDRYGVAAGRAFHEGLGAYDGADLAAASDAFERAVAANAAFTQAWVWLARTRQEQGAYAAAVSAWERVLELDPSDDRARYFATLARQQQGVSPAAGARFAEAVAAYEAAAFERAEALMREVVAIDAGSAVAWGWLGRVLFGERRFAEAADAYGRAAALDPTDDDLAFFAREAAALARAEAGDPDGADDDGPAQDDAP